MTYTHIPPVPIRILYTVYYLKSCLRICSQTLLFIFSINFFLYFCSSKFFKYELTNNNIFFIFYFLLLLLMIQSPVDKFINANKFNWLGSLLTCVKLVCFAGGCLCDTSGFKYFLNLYTHSTCNHTEFIHSLFWNVFGLCACSGIPSQPIF